MAARDRLIGVEEAQERILSLIRESDRPPERRRVDESLGRILAEPVIAAVTLPPWDNSAMDGYAIRASDVATATDGQAVELKVVGEIAAGGEATGTVQSGRAVRIATGARIPPGADAVVQVELTTPVAASGELGSRGRDAAGPLPDRVLVHAAIPPAANIRRAGSDLHAGDPLLSPGVAISPAAIAVIAGAGLAEVVVHPRPIVAVLATGDEIEAAGTDLGASAIPDANGPGLRALAAAAGADVLDLGIARDNLADVLSRLRRALDAGAGAVIVSGGVSVGPYDVVKSAFESLGHVDLWRVAVQPGKPFALATVARGRGSTPLLLFGLPGNPVSGFVTFELFVRPAIRALAGRSDLYRPRDRAVLVDDARTSEGRRAYLRVTADRDEAGAVRRDTTGRAIVRLAKGSAGQGSHVLSALASADALAVVAEDVVIHRAGDEVGLLWLDTW